MLALFGTIIIVYVLWLVVKPLLSRYLQRKFQQKVNDMFRQAYGDDTSRGYPFGGQEPREEEYYARGRKRKIFSREDGEYIEFEDIKVDYTQQSAETSTSASRRTDRSAYTPREPQVSDAEWEDIR